MKKKMEILDHYFKKITAKKIIFIFNLMRLIWSCFVLSNP
jgi:hypothetical protein